MSNDNSMRDPSLQFIHVIGLTINSLTEKLIWVAGHIKKTNP